MARTRLYFYDTPLNKYSVTALLGALESRPGLPESLDVGFFCKCEELLAAARRYLDDGCRVYATEWNAGIILEVTGEVY